MSNDISSIYTKYKNNSCGRKGYCGFKREKETNISPAEYGMFLDKKRCKKLSVYSKGGKR